MKKILTLFLLVSILAGCSCHHKSKTLNGANSKTQYRMHKFNRIIQGAWVNKEYIDEVLKTRSPQAASGSAGFITALSIDTTNIKGDSLSVGVNLGNHEGTILITKFKLAGNRPHFFSPNTPIVMIWVIQ